MLSNKLCVTFNGTAKPIKNKYLYDMYWEGTLEKTQRNLNFNEDNLIENVVLVEGVIQDINSLNNRTTIILKGKKDTDKLVICDMQKNQKIAINNLNLGDEITIKGIFKGTLNDVILLNCIIPQPKTNE